MRSRIENSDVIFMSAAPSAELRYLAQKKKVRMLPAGPPSTPPVQVQIVDMANYKPGRGFLLSVPLRNSIDKNLKERGKTILFMNRKGFSTRTQCSQCGYEIRCERCDVNLIYLYSKRKMVCRLCGQTKEQPKVCPQCKSSYLKSTGMGVEKLESEVSRIFPQARVEHYDSDVKVMPQSFDILIATQAVLREKERLAVPLLGIINIDPELNRSDFRAAQKTFSLLVHLKQMTTGKFIIQTRIPDNYCLKTFRKEDAAAFYREELRFRKETELPPYRHLVAIGLRGAKEDEVFAEASLLCEALEKNLPKDMELADPHADLIPKMRDKYRFTIILKGKAVKKILTLLKKTLSGFKRKRNIIVTVNVDPYS
jgi:primosomal protein N' (replication factor Y)